MKNILFAIIILLVTVSFIPENGKLSAESGKLSGIITYKGSYESSNQANAACEIYAINEAGIKSTQYGDMARFIESFQRNKSEYSLSIYNTIDPVRIRKARDNFDASSNFALTYINELKQLPGTVKGVTTGSGKYSLSLRPGPYYILFISGSIKSNSIPEFRGNYVDIKSAGEAFLNITFEKSENTLFMLITGWQRQGC